MSPRGLLVTFEGGEGSGKSTQIRLLAAHLEGVGRTVRVLREPGGTDAGEAIRQILLDPRFAGLDARAELLLYEAARAQLVSEVIEPALDAGEVVVLDRFYDSSTAYQGYGRGLSLDEVAALNMAATGGLRPDLTLVFDIDLEVGLARATTGGADRLESEDAGFHRRVREGFLAVAADDPRRCRVVDADRPIDDVAADVWQLVSGVLGSRTDGGS